MKTPFNNENETFFNREGLRRLDFVEQYGSISAFDMKSLKNGDSLNETNTVLICKTENILSEAVELILSAPLQYKTNVAVSRMLIDMESKLTQAYIQTNMPIFAKLLTNIKNANKMLCVAEEVPVIGRAGAMNAAGIILHD